MATLAMVSTASVALSTSLDASDNRLTVSHAVPAASAWVWHGTTGFAWNEREDHTHVVIDAASSVNGVSLDTVPTGFMDIEFVGLAANLPLVIETTAGQYHEEASYPDGTIVAWHVPAVPMTMTIADAMTGTTLTTVVISYLADALDGLEMPGAGRESGNTSKHESGRDAKARPCGQCGDPGSEWEDPHAYTYERTESPTLVNGARSFTNDIRITVDACWEHVNSIGFQVSGGYAAARGSAGGVRAHTQRVCSGISSIGGAGQIAGPHQVFQKDTYSDGSWKVYAINPAAGFTSLGWEWNPSKCCHMLQFQNCASNTGQYYSVQEANSGAVTWSGSWSVYGVTGDATTTSTTSNEATVRFECVAQDNFYHRYTMYLVTGDGRMSGMVGAVWKDY